MRRRVLILLPIAVTAGGCSTPDHLSRAEAEVPKFHQAWNDGRAEQIWYQATTPFQNKYPKEEFLALLSSIKMKLGRVKSSNRTAWQALYQGTAVLVSLTQTIFERGEATETFGYRVEGAAAFLTVYFVHSPLLKGSDA
jgi:hypothetical protein